MRTTCRSLRVTFTALVATVVTLIPGLAGGAEPAAIPVYHSPLSLAISPDNATLYVTDRTAGNVTVLDRVGRAKRAEIAVAGQPAQLALAADGGTLYVAERGAGTIAVVDTSKNVVSARIPVGRWPRAVAVGAKTKRLFVANQDSHDVSIVDLSQPPGVPIARVAVVREPSDMALTPDEQRLVVVNQLPLGAATDPRLAAHVTIIDCQRRTVASDVALPPGSTSVHGVCLSPDGRWAYVVHHLGRFNLPITQLERGWASTYALTIVDVTQGTRLATLLLDDLTQGAADPFAVVSSHDGRQLWISHSGVHEVSRVEIGLVHELLVGQVPAQLAALKDGARENVWVRIQQDRSQIAELENDLTALYIAGAIHRFPSGGKGPRDLLLSTDGQELLVANYFTGAVAALDPATGRTVAQISLGAAPEPDAARRGELIFEDATHSFQRWQSCASCHPNGGRTDGLRWDFLRDGIGNPKDTMNLVTAAHTPPHNWRATRENLRICAETGLVDGHRIVPTQQTVDDLFAYLVSLRPEPSPWLQADGGLTESAQRGKLLFQGKGACASCHPGPLFTDQEMHSIGAVSPKEPDGRYDTPSLVEVGRTAPYLHDGRAMTLRDVLTTHNPANAHGETSGLSAAELEDLVAYLMSL